MEHWKLGWTSIDTRTIYCILIAILIWISFESTLLYLFDLFVIPYLSKVEGSLWPFRVVLISFIGFLFWKKLSVKNKNIAFIPYRYLLIMGLISFIYIYYRTSNRYISKPNYWGFGLSDLLILIIIVFIFYRLYFNLKSVNRKIKIADSQDFYPDKPINSGEEDLFGLLLKAKNLKHYIQKDIVLQDKGAFSIGIVGKWGQGKSSFLSLLEKELTNGDSQDIIIVKFNPRHSKGADSIQHDFFQTLFEKLKQENFVFSSVFSDYLKAINVIDNTGFINLFLNRKAFFNKEEDRDTINNELKRNGKKIVIIIDDLDRLQADGIIEVFKLIDYTASFNNIIFVTAYDKSFINNILDEKYHQSESLYSDKYFDMEKHLPPIQEEIIYNFLVDSLKKTVRDDLNKEEEIERVLAQNSSLINSVFLSLRDAKRFLNMFCRQYFLLKDYIDFKDFFLLNIIKFQWYDFYLYFYRKSYIIYMDKFFDDVYLKSSSNQATISYADEIVNKYVNPIANEITLISIIKELSFISESSLRQPALYKIYFNEDEDGDAYKQTYNYMTRFLNKNLIDIKPEIDEYFDINDSSILCSFVADQDLEIITNETELINYLGLLIYANARSKNIRSLYFRLLKFFDLKDIEIKQVKERVGIDDSEFKKLLMNEIKIKSDYPIEFIRSLISKLYPTDNPGDIKIDPIVNSHEILLLSKDYLKAYIKLHPTFTWKHLEILCVCISNITLDEKRTIELDDEACSIVRRLITKSPSEYFKNAINYQHDEIYLEPFYKQLFVSNDEFEKFITDAQYNRIEKVKLIRNYWVLYKANNFKNITLQGKVKLSVDNELKDEIRKLEQLVDLEKSLNNATDLNIDFIIEIEKKIEKNDLTIAKSDELKLKISKKKKELE